MEVPKFKIIVPMLIVCLATSLVFNIYPLFNRSCEIPKTRTFVFYEVNQYRYFTGDLKICKKILNSTELTRVEATFNWETTNLTVAVNVNDDDYNLGDSLGLAFDTNGDGIFEGIYWLNANNHTGRKDYVLYITQYGGIGWLAQMPAVPSTWHYCTFNSSGYYFYFWIPKETIKFQQPMFVHLCFEDGDAMFTGRPALQFENGTVYWKFEV